jgi:trigger factor
VTATVHSVKTKELPELDDDFAQLASEFDTLGEFRSSTRSQLERMKQVQQVVQARDKALEVVLDAIEIPLPAGIVEAEMEQARESVQDQLQRAGMDMDTYLSTTGQSAEEFELDVQQRARRSVKVSLVLDKLARDEEIGVSTEELSGYIARQAEQMGISADRLVQQLSQNGQLPVAAAEVMRGKAMNVIAERVTVTDPSGTVVDVKAALQAPMDGSATASEAEDASEAVASDADDASDAGVEARVPAGAGEVDAEATDAEEDAAK